MQRPSSENPTGFLDLKIERPKSTAAGLKAVANSLKLVIKETKPLRSFKALNVLNQQYGIDCPGCAWPDPDDHRSSLGEYCENGVKAIVEEVSDKALDDTFFQSNSIHDLSLLTDYEIGKKGRIAVPLFKAKDSVHYRQVSWQDALEKIANHLNKLSNPNEAIFYTSGRTSNEAAFLYQLFVRKYGTNNLPDCSNMCHESSGVALNESLGIGKGSVTLDDFYKAEVIIILGQNPGTNHPRMLSALEKAKKNGARIISINPLLEAGLMAFDNPQKITGLIGMSNPLTDLYLQVNINGDMALLMAIEKLLLEESKFDSSILDHKFINDKTHGYEEWKAHIESQDLNYLVAQCGISFDKIKEAVNLIKNKSKIIACWAMGLTQQKNAVDTIKEIVNLLLIKGSIGKPGSGTCPVRGHSNVQGDRTMGIYEKPSKNFLQSLGKTFNFSPPVENGYDVVEAIKAMHEEKGKVFIAMGGNFLSATPDTIYTADALSKCKLTVQISTKLNRSHLITGEEALILPALGRTDLDLNEQGQMQFVSCENSMGIIQMSQGKLTPMSIYMRSEVWIVCELAKAVLKNTNINWDSFKNSYDAIRDKIEQTIPGFNRYNERVRNKNGFALPNGARVGDFNTFNQKANFNKGVIQEINLNEDEFIMMTVRSHDQFNTTIYDLNDRYRGVLNERRVIFVNKEVVKERGWKESQVVNISSYYDKKRIAYNFKIIPYDIPRTCVATYFPETNVLVPISLTADKSNTPVSKAVVVRIEPVMVND